MKRFILSIAILVTFAGAAFADSAGIVVAYYDPLRLQGTSKQNELHDFKYYLPLIQQVIKRDFPNVEFKIVEQGDIVTLPDGSRLNANTARSPMGVILSAKGRKRVDLRGVQTDNDFGCAAAAFFKQPSKACIKKKP